MIVLSIESALNACSVAVSDGDKIIDYVEELSPSRQAETLPILTNLILKRSSISFNNIKRIAINRGPGSFTGIRIGMAFAEGISSANNIEIVSAESLEIIAETAKEAASNFIIIQEAYKNECYLQRYINKTKSSEISLYKWDDLKEIIALNETIFCTNPENMPENYNVSRLIPKADALCKLAVNAKPSKPVPFYFRPPDAKPQILKGIFSNE